MSEPKLCRGDIVDNPKGTPCGCGVTREELDRYSIVVGSGKLCDCGHPFGAHPSEAGAAERTAGTTAAELRAKFSNMELELRQQVHWQNRIIERVSAKMANTSSRVVSRVQNKAALEAQQCWHAGAAWSISSCAYEWALKANEETPPDTKLWTELHNRVAAIPRDRQEDKAGGIQEAVADTLKQQTKLGVPVSLVWADTHKKGGTIDTVDPDFTAAYASVKPTKYTAVAFLELKSARTSVDSNDSLGQAADFIAATLEAQRARSKALVLIFNGIEAVEVRGERATEEESILFYETATEVGVQAWNRFRAFLCSSPSDLGAVQPLTVAGAEYHLTNRIGAGATCRVYNAISCDGKELVVKKYDDEESARLEVERIRSMSTLCWQPDTHKDCVPSVVEQKADTVFVRPKGQHFRIDAEGDRRFLFQHAESLLNLLKQIHRTHNIVHRDLKPDNFFRLPSGHVLLNDWADAVPAGTKLEKITDPTIFCPPVTASEHEATFGLDRYAFVVSCYACTCWPKPHLFLPRTAAMPAAWQNAADLCMLAPHSSDDAAYDTALAALKPLMHSS